MDSFGAEVDRLEASIKSVREGRFLKAVLDKEGGRDKNWLHNLRNRENTPETRYMLSLMASNDFQQSLKNYQDVAELKIHLKTWLESLDVYLELIDIRKRYYEPLLPVVEKRFKKLDTRIRLRIEQRERLDQRLKSIVISRRPDYLATAQERGMKDYLARVELYLSNNPQQYTDEIKQRFSRLKGVLDWRINEAYHERLTNAYKQMQQLDVYINKVKDGYKSFVRTRQAATQSYEGYELPIRHFKTRIQSAQIKVDAILARQGRMIETMAVNELERRRNLLEEFQIKARFALAESYDRATKKQEKAEEERIIEEIEENKAKDQKTKQDAETSEQKKLPVETAPSKNGENVDSQVSEPISTESSEGQENNKNATEAGKAQ